MAITEFKNEYAFLSNFYPSPLMGLGYPTVEHFFQAMKTRDPIDQEMIRRCETPGDAKRAGRRIRIREDWEKIKVDVMRFGLIMKFPPNCDLAVLLLNTHQEILIEGNRWHDNFWGDCVCDTCSHIPGQNVLGRLLMARRKSLQAFVEGQE